MKSQSKRKDNAGTSEFCEEVGKKKSLNWKPIPIVFYITLRFKHQVSEESVFTVKLRAKVSS